MKNWQTESERERKRRWWAAHGSAWRDGRDSSRARKRDLIVRLGATSNRREIRQRAGLDQYELARRLGVSRGTVSRWERGDLPGCKVHIQTLEAVGRYVLFLESDGREVS